MEDDTVDLWEGTQVFVDMLLGQLTDDRNSEDNWWREWGIVHASVIVEPDAELTKENGCGELFWFYDTQQQERIAHLPTIKNIFCPKLDIYIEPETCPCYVDGREREEECRVTKFKIFGWFNNFDKFMQEQEQKQGEGGSASPAEATP